MSRAATPPDAGRAPAAPAADSPAPADVRELAAIFAGGAIGALARVALLDALPHASGRWPWATLVANVAGAFMLGYVATLLRDREPPARLRHALLATGLCGALTTFSTIQLELLQMLEEARLALAAAYALVTVAAGYAAVVVAARLAGRRRGAR